MTTEDAPRKLYAISRRILNQNGCIKKYWYDGASQSFKTEQSRYTNRDAALSMLYSCRAKTHGSPYVYTLHSFTSVPPEEIKTRVVRYTANRVRKFLDAADLDWCNAATLANKIREELDKIWRLEE